MQVEGRQLELGFVEPQINLGVFSRDAAVSRLVTRIAKLAFEIFKRVVEILECLVAIRMVYSMHYDDSGRARLARLFAVAPYIPGD